MCKITNVEECISFLEREWWQEFLFYFDLNDASLNVVCSPFSDHELFPHDPDALFVFEGCVVPSASFLLGNIKTALQDCFLYGVNDPYSFWIFTPEQKARAKEIFDFNFS